jgi:putative phage-type endonuclease
MGTDDAIHQLHRERIGGSMVAGIMGLSPWDSPFSIYQLMIGEAPPKEENAAMRRGKKHEGTVLRELSDRTGLLIEDGKTISRDDFGFPTVAQIDGLILDADGWQPAEAKTTSPWAAGDWDGDDPPLHYYTQVQWQIAHADAVRAYVGAMWGLDEDQFRYVIVQRDQRVIDAMLGTCRSFYFDNVLKRVPPMLDGHPATTTAVQQKYRRSTPEMAKMLNEDAEQWIAQRSAAMTELERWQAVKDEAENQLKTLMADAEVAEAPGWKITWKTQTRTTVDTKALKIDHADLVAKYTKTSESRPFVVKPVKVG